MNNIEQFAFEPQSYHNPLDFLLTESTLALKRKTRSSMESAERQLEIPECQPPVVYGHRDSNRSRRYRDLLCSSP